MAPSEAFRRSCLGEGGPIAYDTRMYYVYCLVCETDPARRYIGFTEDLRQRVQDHNDGCNPSTARARWRLKGYVAFDTKARAQAFERYLKSGSGHAFANRRLW